MTLLLAFGFLTAILLCFMYYGKNWAGTTQNFLYANRSLNVVSTGLAINSHWFWAIAMFVGPAVAYNWGLLGLIWFVIPNACSLLVVAWLTHKLRDQYPEGYSLTEFIQDKFGSKVSKLYQALFIAVALGSILYGFVAVDKFFTFTGLNNTISPMYANLVIAIITLAFTIRGGIRTSVYTGALQTTIWLVFLVSMLAGIIYGGFDFNDFGKNTLNTFSDENFLTTFGIAYAFTILAGATGSGAMWQKSFSMPKENIWPSFIIAAVTFAIVVFSLSSIGLYAHAHNLEVKSADLSALAGMLDAYGPIAITLFGVFLIGQTSTVMDSSMNYISSLITREWFHTENTTSARIIMGVFLLLAWLISCSGIELWTIFMLMGTVRISLFIPLIFQLYGAKIKSAILFYGSFITLIGSFSLAWYAKTHKEPIFDMYNVSYSYGISLVLCLLAIYVNRKNKI